MQKGKIKKGCERMLLKGLFVFLFLILFVGFVYAIPPFQAGTFTDGYEIKVPPIELIKQNLNFDFNFHVFNISNGVPIDNSSTNCFLHIYNSTGEQLILEVPHINSNIPNEWEITVLGGNFSQLGRMGYNVQCNSSILGGFTTNNFLVTKTGEPFDVGVFLSDIFLIVLILFSLIFAYVRHSKIDFEKMDKRIIDSHQNPGKTILKGIGYGLMKNAFLWYYLAGWVLMIIVNDLISRFAASEIASYFVLVLDIYSFGFILVIVVWIGIVWRFVQHLLDITDDIGRGIS